MKSDTKYTKVLIIGSGPAGYTAGVYAARAMLSPVLVQGIQPGGQLTITTEVENYPPFADIQGPELMEKMAQHCRLAGTELVSDHIESLGLTSHPFTAQGESGICYQAETIILATGAAARWLGLASEERFKGRGVSACATCDGFFFRGKHVMVVGGGNTAAEEALFLTRFASKVSLIHRRDRLRADAVLADRLSKNEKINIVWNHEVEEILGDDSGQTVAGVRLRETNSGKTQTIPCDGVFIAIGHSPASQLVTSALELDAAGYVLTRAGTTETSVPGVFAAGDITDSVYRQAISSAGMGCMAALDAARWIEHNTAH